MGFSGFVLNTFYAFFLPKELEKPKEFSFKHHLLVLEALEDQVTLFILKFSDFVIWPHVVIVETLTKIIP